MKNIKEDKHESFFVGVLCGLFLIIGIFAGFLYSDKDEREYFLNGWVAGFFINLARVLITVFIVVF